MSTVFADEAVRIHRSAYLSDVLIAEAVGAKPSTVRDWFNGRSSPTGQRARRLAELAEITDRLLRVRNLSTLLGHVLGWFIGLGWFPALVG